MMLSFEEFNYGLEDVVNGIKNRDGSYKESIQMHDPNRHGSFGVNKKKLLTLHHAGGHDFLTEDGRYHYNAQTRTLTDNKKRFDNTYHFNKNHKQQNVITSDAERTDRVSYNRATKTNRRSLHENLVIAKQMDKERQAEQRRQEAERAQREAHQQLVPSTATRPETQHNPVHDGSVIHLGPAQEIHEDQSCDLLQSETCGRFRTDRQKGRYPGRRGLYGRRDPCARP